MDLPIEAYFAHAYRMSDAETALRDELMDWLPDEIIDAHAHCNLESHIVDVPPKARKHMLSTFPYFPLEDSEQLRGLFFPGKKIRSLRFPKTYRGLDHRAANAYLLENSPKEDRVALFGLPEDVDYTNRMLRHSRVSALKMYWSYVEPSAEYIYDFFRPEILEEAQTLDIPIVLHLPKMIVWSVNDLVKVINDFPRLRIVLAHLGLSVLPVNGLRDAFKLIRHFDQVSTDNSLNPSEEVTQIALEEFGAQRILYGSDEPLNLIRFAAYEHPEKGQRIVTDYLYHWVDAMEYKQYGHLAEGVIHSHWGNLHALQKCIGRLSPSEQTAAKENIFYKNAAGIYGF